MIKFSEVNPISKRLESRINKSIRGVIKKRDFILGDNVKKFEIKFSSYSKAKYSIGCATGTDALLLALM